MKNEAKKELFEGGVPTEPDVKRLLAAFPGLKRGQLVTHAEIEEALGCDHRTSRYRGVVKSWKRKVLNESNLDLQAVPGVGLRVLDEYERVTESARDYRRGIKTVGRAAKRVQRVRVEMLTGEQAAKAEHVQRHALATLEAGRAAVKEIAIRLAPAEANPRLRPVK